MAKKIDTRPAPIKVLEDLISAYEKTPKKWIQEDSIKRSKTGAALGFCMIGGIEYFAEKRGINTLWTGDFRVIDEFVTAALPETTERKSIVSFNDTKGRTVKQVIAVLKRALSKARLHYKTLARQTA